MNFGNLRHDRKRNGILCNLRHTFNFNIFGIYQQINLLISLNTKIVHTKRKFIFINYNIYIFIYNSFINLN